MKNTWDLMKEVAKDEVRKSGQKEVQKTVDMGPKPTIGDTTKLQKRRKISSQTARNYLLIPDDFELLKKKLKTDGYLFIRGFHNQNRIEGARNFVLRAINEDGGLKKDSRIEDGLVGKDNKNYAFLRNLEVAHSKEILAVVNSQKTFNFFVYIILLFCRKT